MKICKRKGCKGKIGARAKIYCSRRCGALSRPHTHFGQGHKYYAPYSNGAPKPPKRRPKSKMPKQPSLAAYREYQRMRKKMPPLEELNRAWMELGSYEKIAERYKVEEKVIVAWLGPKQYLRTPRKSTFEYDPIKKEEIQDPLLYRITIKQIDREMEG